MYSERQKRILTDIAQGLGLPEPARDAVQVEQSAGYMDSVVETADFAVALMGAIGSAVASVGERRGLGKHQVCQAAFADRGNELVPAPGKGLNENRVLRIVAERASDVEHMPLNGLRLDVRIRPYGHQEFVVGHQPAGVFHQIPQNRERRRSQQNPLVSFRSPLAP